MEAQAPDTNLQFELLALLVFHDKEAKYVRSAVDLTLYDSQPIRVLAREVYDFLDNFQAAPKAHFAEIIGKHLTGDEKEIYENIYSRIGRLRQGLNPGYIISKLDEFLSTQTLQLGIIEAYDALEKKDIEGARKKLYDASKKHATFSDPGLFLTNAAALIYAPDPRGEFTTGVKQLDDKRFCPARGEVMTLMGLSGKSKTWWLVNIGAQNMKIGKKVFHVSLENSDRQCATRYVQNMMFLTRDFAKTIEYFHLQDGPMGSYLVNPESKQVHGLLDEVVMAKLHQKLTTNPIFNSLVIKNWPQYTLTLSRLETHLDLLEQTQGFMPDILLVDYPDIFKMNSKNERRLEIGDVFSGLKRIAVERNVAVVAVSQSNRGGVNKAILTESEVAEDFTKYQISDAFASINMTDEEKRMGLARIYVLKNRDDVDRYCVVVNQALEVGQVAMGSVNYHEREYKKFITQFGGDATLDEPVS